MQEIRYVNVNGNRIPVLISDEREALLAAKTAGRAVVELLGSQGCGPGTKAAGRGQKARTRGKPEPRGIRGWERRSLP